MFFTSTVSIDTYEKRVNGINWLAIKKFNHSTYIWRIFTSFYIPLEGLVNQALVTIQYGLYLALCNVRRRPTTLTR